MSGSGSVLVLIGDLIFGSKVREAMKNLQIEPTFVSSAQAVADRPSGDIALLIVDVNDARLGPLEAIQNAKKKGMRVLAFGSHADAEALERARTAGADRVVPRSVFSSQLGELVASLMQAEGP